MWRRDNIQSSTFLRSDTTSPDISATDAPFPPSPGINEMSFQEFTKEAQRLDAEYPSCSDLFQFPTLKSLGLPHNESDSDKSSNYLCGNSLGLMPNSTPGAINQELQAWGARAVESHFRHPVEGSDWVSVDQDIPKLLAPIVGAKENEVACMGTLTMNLNALMTSFYKPDSKRFKIMFEKGSFPSDYYAFLNQAKLHGFDENALIQLAPRDGEFFLRTEDILQSINENGDEIAVVCFPGIQYYTGQFFEIERITKKAHSKGCIVGWDLAHAVGNVEIKLHDWNVDFAAWCHYKYLNSGPGAIGGFFIHEQYTTDNKNWKPRLAGWWGNNAADRFKMLEHFDPIPSALSFRQSNPSVIDVVSLKSSLETFTKCGGIKELRLKSIELTNFLEKLLLVSSYYRSIEDSKSTTSPHFIILTPSDSNHRGAQLSLLFKPHHDSASENIMEQIFKYLNDRGVICDERRPDVIRLAPTPSYNTFTNCLECVTLLNEAFASLKA